MLKTLTQTSLLLDLPVWSMLIFFCLFVAAIGWALSRRRGGHYQTMSQLPLGGDEVQFESRCNDMEVQR